MVRMIEDPDTLEEIRDGLILDLNPPPLVGEDGNPTIPDRGDVVFPAHAIWCICEMMLRSDMLLETQNLVAIVINDIMTCVKERKETALGVFWLVNAHEMVNLVTGHYQSIMPAQGARTAAKKTAAAPAPSRAETNVVRKLYADMQDLETRLLGWVVEREQRTVAGLSVAGVLETQDLPGLRSSRGGGAGGGLFGVAAAALGWGGGAATATGTAGADTTAVVAETGLQRLKRHLGGLDGVLRAYHACEEHRAEVLVEMVRVVGVTAFNGIMTKRAFADFRRGCQVQYNVTQLEEWCVKHRVKDAVPYLQRVMQAAKVLTLNKMTPADADAMLELASFLNPNQVRRLLAGYQPNDPDSPMRSEFSAALNYRALATQATDAVLVSLEPRGSAGSVPPHPVPAAVMDAATVLAPGVRGLPRVHALLQHAAAATAAAAGAGADPPKVDPEVAAEKAELEKEVAELGDIPEAEYLDEIYDIIDSVVSRTDDPTLAALTLRTWILGIFFGFLYALVNTLFTFRTNQI
ncbi:Myosin type-2 heavy chain 1, partial [Cladochytrium tenue]